MTAPKRDAAATRARILAAATAEFATHGIAGARVDRIAVAAQANKNMIYIYFGSKEQLFDGVLAEAIEQLLETVPMDATDLPGYAGALYDHMVRHPDLSRLARWFGLEKPGGFLELEEAMTNTLAKINRIAAAQADGLVTNELAPDQIVALVVGITATWSAGSPELADVEVSAELIESRRAAVVLVVARMVAP
ncbi:AcrR family transcriptional regulator [Nakamurella sp. UYEF19]|uniref:TetR family transcriptional regulator n=1 Tax=Nakamurella sp. UYEF19 TaxID=1756392 RepID=UPI003395BFDD